ncbi:MAG: peptide chain release factor 1 [Candidatus Brocadiia bacterium]
MDALKENIKERVSEMLEEKVQRHRELEQKLADPDLASNSGRYAHVAREHGELTKFRDMYRQLQEARQRKKEAEELLEESDEDPELTELAEDEIKAADKSENEILHEVLGELCSDSEEAHRSAIMEIRSGTGGQEAALFAADLFGMYKHYAQQKGWKVRCLDKSITDMGGFKHIVLSISGNGVWQHLRFESGGHRVQRVPKTESQGRIHTSLATVAVLPEVREVEVELKPEDLDISFMRSTGPGGQNVNKVDSCVRIVHEPTGIAVKCQEEKSQHKNRKQALKLLRAKIYEKQQEEQKEKRDELRRTQVGSGDRNQRVRTYNFPQDRVTDHRIGLDTFGIETVLMGKLDPIVEALKEWDKQARIRALAEDS